MMLVLLATCQLFQVAEEILALSLLPAIKGLIVWNSKDSVGEKHLQNAVTRLYHAPF